MTQTWALKYNFSIISFRLCARNNVQVSGHQMENSVPLRSIIALMLVCPLFDAGGRRYHWLSFSLLLSFFFCYYSSSSLLSFISILQLFRGHQTLFAFLICFWIDTFIIARWRSTVWQYVRLSSIYTFNDVTDIIDSQIDVKYVPCFVPLDGFFTRFMNLPDSYYSVIRKYLYMYTYIFYSFW